MRTCPACGQTNPVEAKFCAECGSALQAAREVRKIVTVLFSDVTGSTAMADGADPEKVRRVMSRYFEEVTRIIENHHGTVEKFIGDAVMAVFGLPQAHEDDALRAVRAAVDLRDALRDLNRELEEQRGVRIAIRTGVNTGEVVAGDANIRQALVTGDTVNVAARLEQAAGPDEILIGASTLHLTEHAVEGERLNGVQAKGKREGLTAFRVAAVRERAPGRVRRFESALVGRRDELAALEGVWDDAVTSRECRLVTVVGDAGVGKTRLASEFRAGRSNATVLTGRCLAYGEGITYWPMVEILSQAAGISDVDDQSVAIAKLDSLLDGVESREAIASRLAVMVGLSREPATPEDLAWAARKTLEAIASARPLLVEFDDIHWAEASLLDLIAGIAETSSGYPIALVCLTRPDLVEERPAWTTIPRGTIVSLEGLDERDSSALIDQLLGAADVPPDLRARIAVAASGTPLFVEEIVAMLIDDGKLVSSDGRWVAASDISSVEIPPTLQSLLASRLDRLDVSVREVLERASVIGKDFPRDAVAELSDAADVGAALEQLNGKRFVAPRRGDEEWSFRHILIRDAAYEAIPKTDRVRLHQRFADWMEKTSRDRLREHEEIVAYHLESAYHYALDLGPATDATRALAARAATVLTAAGMRAAGRSDTEAVVSLLGRADALLDAESPERIPVLNELLEAHLDRGEFPEAKDALERFTGLIDRIGEADLQPVAELARVHYELTTSEAAIEVGAWKQRVEAVLPQLEGSGDAGALALAHWLLGHCDNALCRSETMERHFLTSAEFAVAAGDTRQEVLSMHWALFAGTLGPQHAAVVRDRARAFAAEQRAVSRAIHGYALTLEATMDAALDNVDRARELHRRGQEILADVGKVLHASSSMTAGWIEVWQGDYHAAAEQLEEGHRILEAIGEQGFRSTVTADLSHALFEIGRYDEADRFAAISESISLPDDVSAQSGWRSTRGRLLALDGRHEEALAMGRSAVETYEGSDQTHFVAKAYQDLADIHRMAGRIDDARAALEVAVDLYSAKPVIPAARQARVRLEKLITR